MRPLEFTLLLLLALWFLWPLFSARRSSGRPFLYTLLPAAAVLLIFIHWFLEGYRWQMLPLYILTLGTALALGFSAGRRRSSWRPPAAAQNLLRALLGLLLLGAAAFLPLALPVPALPQPGGPYAIGTFSQVLTDPQRLELYSQDPNQPRRILVQVWYPALPTPQSQPAPWLEPMDRYGPAIAGWLGLPSFFLDHVALARSHSFLDAPLAEAPGRLPVLLFSHGWGGFRAQNTYQMEELASHGYLVAAIEHPYGSVATVFPDGSLALNNPAALPLDAPPAELAAAGNRLVTQWGGDMALTLDYLVQLNQAGPGERFNGRLDLERVGIFGHSTGAGAAVEFCAHDPRCKAGLGLDAYLTPVSSSVLEGGLRQPFLFLFSELWPSEKNKNLYRQLQTASDDSRAFVLLGADHYDFTDLPLLSPLAPQLGLKGPINGGRALRIINAYSLAFFDHWLKGEPAAALLSAPPPDYPEVSAGVAP